MFTICRTYLRSYIDFLLCKRCCTREEVQRDDVTLWVWDSFSVSIDFGYTSFAMLLSIVRKNNYIFFCRSNYVQDMPSKPLHLPSGYDSFDKIDNNTSGSESIRSMHKYRNIFTSNFKQVNKYNNNS